MVKRKTYALLLIALMYVIAFAIATLGCYFLKDVIHNPILNLLIGDVIATTIIFIFGMIINNASVYDAYWSVAPIWIAVGYYLLGNFRFHPLQLWVLIPLGLWAIRLTYNWAKGFTDLKWQDFRYTDLKRKFPRLYALICFLGIMLMPTLLVFAGMIPMYYMLSHDFHAGIFMVYPTIHQVNARFLFAGGVIILFATIYQGIADYQKRKFLNNPENKGKCIDKGLWRVSRHPNYLGEILVWWGLFISSLYNFSWVSIIGPIAITLLFLFISIPLMENHLKISRPEAFIDYKKRVRSSLFPWFYKK